MTTNLKMVESALRWFGSFLAEVSSPRVQRRQPRWLAGRPWLVVGVRRWVQLKLARAENGRQQRRSALGWLAKSASKLSRATGGLERRRGGQIDDRNAIWSSESWAVSRDSGGFWRRFWAEMVRPGAEQRRGVLVVRWSGRNSLVRRWTVVVRVWSGLGERKWIVRRESPKI